MNSDAISSAVTKAAIAVLTWLAARYLPNDPAASYIPTVAAGLGAIAAFGYGVYNHWNMKKVAQNAIVVAPPVAPQPPKGT